MTAIISVVLVAIISLYALKLLVLLPKIFLYATAAAWLTIKFVAKKFLVALPWMLCAGVAVTVAGFALARQFFTNADAKVYVEKFLPPREFERETFSLAVIELMLVVRENF